VVVVAFDGARSLDIVGPLEVLTVTNEQGAHYATEIATPGGADVRTTTGSRLGADVALEHVEGEIDTLLVAGSPDWTLLHDDGVVAGVRALAPRARRVTAVCTGTFALAAAGLLDGRRAATHWRHADALIREHPHVEVDPDALFVRDGCYYTSGGIASGIDLVLALVEEDLGADIARATARVLVVFMQRPGGQSQFSARDVGTSVLHRSLRSVLDAIVVDPAGHHTLPVMAERAGFSERHLTRLFKEHLNLSPGEYVEHVRVEAARARLEKTDDALDDVARSVGFGSAETLRRAFLRNVKVTPGDYRSRFRTTGIGVDAVIGTVSGADDAAAPRESSRRDSVAHPR
jgi:transcriptional regulator GlxA family with amidase domain